MSLLCVSYLSPQFVSIILKPRQVVWAGIPGSEVGNALTDVLYGAWNPSGKLPYTIAKSASDYPTQVITGGEPGDALSIPYTEGWVPVRLTWLKDEVVLTPVQQVVYRLQVL